MDADRLYKIIDGDSIWHRIGDACYLGKDKNIYYCEGTHRVTSRDSTGNEIILYSEPVELIFNLHSKVRRSALIAIDGGGKAAVAIEPHPSYFPNSSGTYSSLITELREQALSCSYTAAITDFFFFHNFPVDTQHNAKVFREQLGQLAESGESDYTQATTDS